MQTRVCSTTVRNWSGCRDCILWRTRRRVALRRDSGPRKRIHLLIIGEAPGEMEDAEGIPFVGPSGCILNKMIEYVRFPFSYTITNIVNCRPMTIMMLDDALDKLYAEDQVDLSKYVLGDDFEVVDKNREPTKAEEDKCRPHIFELINDTHPEGIVFLGKVAEGFKKHMTKERIRIPTLSLFHPAFIARMELKVLTVKRQARKLEKFLEKIGGIT